MRLINKLRKVIEKGILISSLLFFPSKISSLWWVSPRQVVRPSIDGVSAVGVDAELLRNHFKE
jgi:hypothetical protein